MNDAARISIVAKRGIFLPQAGLWVDPWDRQETAFVSHAHSDHFGAHGTIICSKPTAALIKARFGERFRTEPHMFGRAWTFNGHRLVLLPAGHTLGSAQIHVTRLSDGATLLYSGDFKLRASRTAEAVRTMPADTLIMETTFGLPQFRFPGTTRVRNALVRFCRDALDDEAVPVLLAYALGKAQELLAQLEGGGFEFALHPSVWEMTRAYEQWGVSFPPYEKFEPGSEVRGKVLVVPPGAARSQALRGIRNRRLALCSGWALTPGAKFRYQVDEVFPLSDHADFPDLLRYVEAVRPRLVLTTHGYASDFARVLRERGFDAWSLGADDQLEFPFGFGTEDPAPDDDETGAPAPPPVSEFERFVRVCDEIGASTGRLRRIALLTDWFRAFGDTDQTASSARFFCGRAAATRHEQKLIGTGWAIIRMALMNVTGLSPRRIREIASSQNDAGRTTFLALMHAQDSTPRPMALHDVSDGVRRLIDARGALAKAGVLEGFFRQMTPAEASYLVKILTGDMRIGLKDGLVEESLAAAFDAPLLSVRHAHMLTGDIGETARLAARRELDSVRLTVFQPLRPMLASTDDREPDSDEGRIGADDGESRTDGAREVWIEDHLDGLRAQLHKQGKRAELFASDLRNVSAEFPDIAGPAATISRDLVLDGVMVALADGSPAGFPALQERLERPEPDFFIGNHVPVRFIAFDLLWLDGNTLVHLPLRERRAHLESLELPPPISLIPIRIAKSPGEIDAALDAARAGGHDALITKDPQSPYTPGRRSRTWVRLSTTRE